MPVTTRISTIRAGKASGSGGVQLSSVSVSRSPSASGSASASSPRVSVSVGTASSAVPFFLERLTLIARKITKPTTRAAKMRVKIRSVVRKERSDMADSFFHS